MERDVKKPCPSRDPAVLTEPGPRCDYYAGHEGEHYHRCIVCGERSWSDDRRRDQV
jgi:hypothetical protein